MLKAFKDFAFRGNLIDVAIAFVLGVAFAAVVTSLVDDVIMQLVGALVGEPDFSDLTFSVGDGVIRYGSFLTALVTFLIIAFVLFLIVQAIQKVMPAKATTRECPHCLSEIPTGAGTCAYCAKDSPATAAAV
jgi:large conductance mechanosensitive channel